MAPEKPATGILKQSDFSIAKFYYVQCECGDPSCSHTIEVEADEVEVSVHIYSTVHTKWWECNRWKQIWQIFTRGYAEMQTTTVLSEQAVLNYADALVSAMDDVKEFRADRKKV
jgi:hypothetical protein